MTERDPIDALVRAALWRTRGARALESVLLGTSAALTTAMACELSQADALRADALAVQALAALACGASWWVEHAPDAASVARHADRELGCEGALLTAWERGSSSGPLGALLAERVRGRLPTDAVGRATRKPLLALLSAPLGLAALWLALPPTPAAMPSSTLELVARTRASLQRAAPSAPEGSTLRAELEQAALELAAPIPAPQQAAAALERAVQALEQGLAGKASSAEPSQLAALDLARASLGELGGPAGSSQVPGGAFGGSSAAEGMQNEPPLRTMTGSPQGSTAGGTPTSPVPSPVAPAERAPERGTTAGRWWAPEDDAVVSAWRARAGQVPR